MKTLSLQKQGSLYIHIPFCSKKCKFCFIDVIEGVSKDILTDYVEYILQEIEYIAQYSKNTIVNSIYIGGGTPTILSVELLQRLIDVCYANFCISDSVIIELDATPVTITRSLLEFCKNNNIKTINLGIQSTEKQVLSSIGREWQTMKIIENAGKLLQKYQIDTHLDFIVGLPGEKISSFREQIDLLYLLYKPKSLSINIYEETVYNFDFYTPEKHSYPKYKNLEKLAGILDSYIYSKYGLTREHTLYISSFYQKRNMVIGIGAGAFGYIPGFGIYKNLNFSRYQKDQGIYKNIIPMTNSDEGIMYLLHNYNSDKFMDMYQEQFSNPFWEHFPVLFDQGKEKGFISQNEKGVWVFERKNRKELHRFLVTFYSPYITSLYSQLNFMSLAEIETKFNKSYL